LSNEREYQQIARNVSLQIERNIIVNKPYLINIIQYGRKKLANKEANEIIRKMITEGKIDENLALSKKERPYSFYLATSGKFSLDRIILPLKEALIEKKKLTISEASKITGYSGIATRVLLTHLLLIGGVDYSGDIESPIFYIPWG
jgi:hypothetical protein